MKNFFSLLLALMFSCTFTVCAFAAEPYAENSNPPTLQDTLQEILDNPINISSGHFMSVSGYNLSNATIQVTDPDVTNQQSSSSYSSGKYYINSSVVYSTCDYFAA